LLGEHHDMHVLRSATASFRDRISASMFPGLEPGLGLVVRLVEEASLGAFERFRAIWGGTLGSRILSRTEELGRGLDSLPDPGEPQGSEPAQDSAKTSTRSHKEHGGHEGQVRSREEFLGQEHTNKVEFLPAPAGDPDSVAVLWNKNMP
jgi:hypothetical protein